MKDLVNKIISLNYDEIDNLVLNLNEKIGLNVSVANHKYEFIIHLIDYDEDTVVFCPKELDYYQRKEYKNRAYFENQLWSDEINHNTIYFNDPTRYTFNYLAGTCAMGTSQLWHLENIAKIIKALSDVILSHNEKSSISNDSLYFYGQSTGGFMAMALSVMIENSTSIIEKPIFNLKNSDFWPGIRGNCFKNISENDIIKYVNRYNIISLIKSKDYIPNSYIILDSDNKNEWKTQYNQFLDDLNGLNYLHNGTGNKINIQVGATVNSSTHVSNILISNLIDEIIYLEDRKKSFDSIRLHMITEFEEEMDVYYEKYQNNEVTFDEFITLKNDYIGLWQLARLDAKNIGDKNNKVEIISDNKKISVTYPQWFKNEEGEGVLLFSRDKSFKFKIKTINGGRLRIQLRGNDFVNDQNIRKVVYTVFSKLKLNGDLIINKDVLVWHNEPYVYERTCINNEIIEMEIEYKTLFDYYPHIGELTEQMDAGEEELEKTYEMFKSHMKYLKMLNTHT